MNPAEWLRSVTHRTDDDDLAVEAAEALASFARQPGLVVACRRLLAHHPDHGVLWWVCSVVLTAPDAQAAAAEVVRRIDADRTPDRLAAALPVLDPDQVVVTSGWNGVIDRALSERADLAAVVVRVGGADPVGALRRRRADHSVRVVDPWEVAVLPVGHAIVPAAALGADRVLVRWGSSEMLDQLASTVPVWLVGGVGRVLPPTVLAAIERASAGRPGREPGLEVVSPERFDRVVTTQGVERTHDVLGRFDCPIAPELLRPLD